MSVNLFIKNENIQMLWDLISDEELFRFLTPDIQNTVYNVFLKNIQGFFEAERKKATSLVELNKKYILLILNHIKKTYPYQPSKIKIHNEHPIKESITFEEIQNEKRSQFDKDYSRRQEEFEDSMTLKAPPLPEFSDPKGKEDGPIKEMDKILKQMQAQRNYEVEQINRIYNDSSQTDNWLKSQETSLKSNKFQNNDTNNNQENNTSNRFKFLGQLNESVKKVTFSDTEQIKTFINDEEDDNEDITLFSKLKKLDKEDMKDTNPIIKNKEIQDRLDNLESNFKNLNDKIDKILELINKRI